MFGKLKGSVQINPTHPLQLQPLVVRTALPLSLKSAAAVRVWPENLFRKTLRWRALTFERQGFWNVSMFGKFKGSIQFNPTHPFQLQPQVVRTAPPLSTQISGGRLWPENLFRKALRWKALTFESLEELVCRGKCRGGH